MQNVAIIGLGSIGKRHLKALLKSKEKYSIDKIHIFDLSKDRLSEIKEDDIIIHSDINKINSVCETIFICTPTANHTETLESVIKGNANKIYLEKPLGADLNGFRKFYEMSKRGRLSKQITLGYMLRFHPVISKIKEIIESNKLGKILHARAACGFYLPYWHPHEDYRDFYMSSRAQGGGVLLDTSHEIDYLTWLIGDVDSVFGTVLHVSDLDIYADDLTRFSGITKQGINFDIHLDLLQFNKERFIQIIFSKGVLKGDLVTGEIIVNSPDKELNKTLNLNIDFNIIYEYAHNQFFNCKSYPPSELATLENGYKVLEIIEAVRMSSSTRSQINLPIWTIN